MFVYIKSMSSTIHLSSYRVKMHAPKIAAPLNASLAQLVVTSEVTYRGCCKLHRNIVYILYIISMFFFMLRELCNSVSVDKLDLHTLGVEDEYTLFHIVFFKAIALKYDLYITSLKALEENHPDRKVPVWVQDLKGYDGRHFHHKAASREVS